MSSPWDIPPLFEPGDGDDDATYTGVGRVVCRWEEIEVELSHLYSIFIGRPHEGDAIRTYGIPRIFSDRLIGLGQAATSYFVRACNQEAEGTFNEIVIRLRGFVNRRNEVAHGSVRQVRRLQPHPDGKIYYLLLPSHYDARKFDSSDMPTFAYSSENLLIVEERLFWLAKEIAVFASSLLPQEEQEPQ